MNAIYTRFENIRRADVSVRTRIYAQQRNNTADSVARVRFLPSVQRMCQAFPMPNIRLN